MKQIILHIGTHKTGSTSIQRFMRDQAEYLSSCHRIAFYRGELNETNHRELDLASMRYERDSFARLGNSKHVRCDSHYTQQVVRRVQAFLASRNEHKVVFSSEALSWIRYEDEIERLRAILNADSSKVTVVLYLRNKEDYLKSYTRQIYRVAGRAPSDDVNSCLYVGPGTWLTDYDRLIACYREGFGADNVVIIDYDEQVRKFGNVIPAFLDVLEISPMKKLDLPWYFLNTSDPALERKPYRGVKRLLKRAVYGWRGWRRGRAA